MKASNFHWLSLGVGGYKLIIYTHHGVIFSYKEQTYNVIYRKNK